MSEFRIIRHGRTKAVIEVTGRPTARELLALGKRLHWMARLPPAEGQRAPRPEHEALWRLVKARGGPPKRGAARRQRRERRQAPGYENLYGPTARRSRAPLTDFWEGIRRELRGEGFPYKSWQAVRIAYVRLAVRMEHRGTSSSTSKRRGRAK